MSNRQILTSALPYSKFSYSNMQLLIRPIVCDQTAQMNQSVYSCTSIKRPVIKVLKYRKEWELKPIFNGHRALDTLGLALFQEYDKGKYSL